MLGMSDPGPVSRRTTSALSHHPPDWILNIYYISTLHIYTEYLHSIYTISTLGNSECSHLSPVLYLTSDKSWGSVWQRGAEGHLSACHQEISVAGRRSGGGGVSYVVLLDKLSRIHMPLL